MGIAEKSLLPTGLMVQHDKEKKGNLIVLYREREVRNDIENKAS